MGISIFLLLAVLLPFIALAIIGPKLILIKSIWVIAAALALTAGVALIGYGGLVSALGFFFAASGALIAITAVWSYFRVRSKEVGPFG